MNQVTIIIQGKFYTDRPYDRTLVKWIQRTNNAIRFNELNGNQQEADNLKTHRDYLGEMLSLSGR